MFCGSSLAASGYGSPTSSTASFSASRFSGIPFGKMHFRLAKLALSPFGKEVEFRNRRLGDFLKELDLTEGRSTGVPTIQEKLADNGSPRATFETTEDRLTFLIHIPIHAGCGNKPATEKTTVITTEKSAIGSEKSAIGSEKNGSGSEKSSEKSQAIISAIRLNPKVTAAEIAMKLGVSSRAVEKRIKTLRENGVIRRIGGDKGGYWEVIENGTEQ